MTQSPHITLTQNQLSLAKYPAYIYMMSNATNSTLYIGVTSNLAKRIYEHKHKLMQGFSQKYNCTRLVYFEAFENISQAIEREKYLKGKKREFKNKLIESINPQYKDLSEFLGLDTAFTTKGDKIWLRKDFSLTCHTEPLGEVSHNTESTTESKRDFSPFSKAQNDKHRDFSFATQTQNDNVFYHD